MFQRPPQSDARALRHSNNRRARDGERFEQVVDIVHILLEARRTGGAAEAPSVERDHAISIGEQIDLCSPHFQIECPPVHQYDGRTFSSTTRPQACAFHLDVLRAAQRRPHNRSEAMAAPSDSDFSLR